MAYLQIRDVPDAVRAVLAERARENGQLLHGDPAVDAVVQWLSDVTTATAPTEPHLARRWQLRSNLSAYDAGYVAVAESHDVTLVTAGGRIERAGVARCPVLVIR